MSTTKERPILFSGAMVRALLDGSKTQTRRMVKQKHLPWLDNSVTNFLDGKWNQRPLPYGQPGDRLWVRETFVQGWPYDPITDCIQQFSEDGEEVPKKTWYRADGADIGWCDGDGWEANTPWKPSIHMPRTASRITLEITSVRVERLQDISRGDAMAEGCPFPNMEQGADPRKWYAELWGAINGPASWATNPWVWVVSFKKVTP